MSQLEAIRTRNSDISMLHLTHIRSLLSKYVNTVYYTAQLSMAQSQEKWLLRDVDIFLSYI